MKETIDERFRSLLSKEEKKKKDKKKSKKEWKKSLINKS